MRTVIKKALYRYHPDSELGGDVTEKDVQYTFDKYAEDGLFLRCQVDVDGKPYWVFDKVTKQ